MEVRIKMTSKELSPNERKAKSLAKGLFCIAVGVAGLYIGDCNGGERAAPESVMYQDVNSDNRKDIVVKSSNGIDTVFFGQEDGSYHSIEDIRDAKQKNLEGELKSYKITSKK